MICYQASRLRNRTPPTTSRSAVQTANTANWPHEENRCESCGPGFPALTARLHARLGGQEPPGN